MTPPSIARDVSTSARIFDKGPVHDDASTPRARREFERERDDATHRATTDRLARTCTRARTGTTLEVTVIMVSNV